MVIELVRFSKTWFWVALQDGGAHSAVHALQALAKNKEDSRMFVQGLQPVDRLILAHQALTGTGTVVNWEE